MKLKNSIYRVFFHFICITSSLFLLVCVSLESLSAQQVYRKTSGVINIGSQRQLFVDSFLIERLTGGAELRLHHPVPREVALKCDKPWEGNGSGYFSIFKDGSIYRMYYRGVQINRFEKGKKKGMDKEALRNKICYAESRDGIHWYKPDLDLYAFRGSKKNNIVLESGEIAGMHLNLGDNASFFKDKSPNVPPDARYKAIVSANHDNPRGLLAFKSSDGIHWSPMSTKLIITDGAFDSQNLAFWDSAAGVYRAYWRIYENGIRGIRTATSHDFIHWKHHVDLHYEDSSNEQLYTNQIKPYPRAPQLLIGFPTRYTDRGWSESMLALPEPKYRELRSSVSAREGTAITEGLIMSSMDGITFQRWNDAFLRPGIERPGTWNYGQQYIAWGMIETKSSLPGAPDELSLYATEDYKSQRPIGTRLRRYTLRLDGFVSVHAPMSGGLLITKPIRFSGTRLILNFSTSAAGTIWVEIRDIKGQPIPGFTKEDCCPIFGDTISRTVIWKNGSDVSALDGIPVQLYFYLKDADFYSFKFEK